MPGYALVLFLIFVGMGVYTVRGGQAALERYRLLDTRGQAASGQVTGKSMTGSKNTRYLLDYTFTDAGGARRDGVSPVSSSVYYATQTGGPVSVTYLPDRKNVATIGQSVGKRDAQTDVHAGYFLIVLGCALASFLALVPFLARRNALGAAG